MGQNLIIVISLLNLGLSTLAILHEFMGKSIKLFNDLRVLLIMIVLSPILVIGTTLFSSSMLGGSYGSILLFVLMNVGMWMFFLPFFLIALKQTFMILNYAVDHYGDGPEKDEEIDKLIESGEDYKALRQLRYLESRFPKNLYINEKLLVIFEKQYNNKAALDKLYSLCRFHSDHEKVDTWVEHAKMIDPIAGKHLEQLVESNFNR